MRALLALFIVVVLPSLSLADAPHELLEEAKGLIVVGACAEGTLPANVKPEIVAAHCKKVKAAQEQYTKSWVAVAREFFQANVPATVPKTVVYPFAGGDLSTALTVYPNADEITTLSLEPAGDPRALGKLGAKQLKSALATVATELTSLYRANFSVTMNMITAMRAGQLPTQLIFSLSALALHGYEPTSMRYFKLSPEGDVVYLTTADFEAIDKIKAVGKRNQALAHVEIRFRKKGSTKDQVYRHIQANLDDNHLRKDPAALVHLTKKGRVAGMTKAASYLLTFDDFKAMRKYIIENVDWMVSDSTGLPPKYGTPAGFEYETYGTYEKSNMTAGATVTPAWRAQYKAQPKRDLKFRFGYPDGKLRGHLIIMRKAVSPPETKPTPPVPTTGKTK
ncbi:MAG: hypothetical protein M4D80_30900 [Myxococcota bacterium]|nr:hypothetical protein [Deltaproteobacteria bacterium]MDQ3339597.1 hypothetical protein [Myxococcota bacterium]